MINLVLALFTCIVSFLPYAANLDKARYLSRSENVVNVVQDFDNQLSKDAYDYNGSVYYFSTEDFTFNKLYFGGLSSFGEVWSLYDDREFVYDFTGTQVSEIKYNILANDNNELSSYNLSGITRVRVGKEIANGYYNYFLYFYTSANEQNVSSFGCDYFVYKDLYRYGQGDLNGDLCTTQYWYVNASNTFTVYPRGLIISFYGAGGYDLWDWYTVSTEPGTYDDGFNDGQSKGYQEGYQTGYLDGTDVDATASTIFTGILDVSLIPVNVFLTIFNFEVFGINIGGVVSGLLTLSVVIIILRFLFGGKKDD